MKTERIWPSETRVYLLDGTTIILDDDDLRRFSDERRAWELLVATCEPEDRGWLLATMPSLIGYARIER